MKRIAENGERYAAFLYHGQYLPDVAVQQRVSPSDVKVRQPVDFPAHFLTLRGHLLCLVERHLYQMRMPLCEDIAVVAALVATVGDMPLKREVFHPEWERLGWYAPGAPHQAFLLFTGAAGGAASSGLGFGLLIANSAGRAACASRLFGLSRCAEVRLCGVLYSTVVDTLHSRVCYGLNFYFNANIVNYDLRIK